MKYILKLNSVGIGVGTLIICIIIMISVSGCSTSNIVKPPSNITTGQEGNLTGTLYYDFDDILFPVELKIDRKKSFVYQAPGYSAGLLAASGRIDAYSLIQFFETNMVQDNWKIISAFKSIQTIMLFQKANKWCIIGISEKLTKSHVEIWVSPTINPPDPVDMSEDPDDGLFK